jgi:hypothetical protein
VGPGRIKRSQTGRKTLRRHNRAAEAVRDGTSPANGLPWYVWAGTTTGD